MWPRSVRAGLFGQVLTVSLFNFRSQVGKTKTHILGPDRSDRLHIVSLFTDPPKYDINEFKDRRVLTKSEGFDRQMSFRMWVLSSNCQVWDLGTTCLQDFAVIL